MMKSKLFSVLSLLVIVGWSSFIDAHPYGAPDTACSTMIPNHGLTWQKTTAPYEIVLDKTAIRSSESLTIRLGVKSEVGTDEPAFGGFKGFLVMAFDATGVDIEPLGSFNAPTSSDVQTLDCPSLTQGQKPKAGVTHTDKDLKKSIEVVWTPPADYIGPIIIQVTFVQERDIFWVRETSRYVDILPNESSTEPITTEATTLETTEETTPTTTTKASATTEATTLETTEETTPTTTTKVPATTAAPGGSESSFVASWTVLLIVCLFSSLIKDQF